MGSRPLNAVHLHGIMGCVISQDALCTPVSALCFKLHAGVQIKGSRERAVAARLSSGLLQHLESISRP